MIRKLMLALMILAMAAVPVPALARDGGHGSRGSRSHGGREVHGHGFHEFHSGHQGFRGFGGFYPVPYYYAAPCAYAPPNCDWQQGYWTNQPYVDAYGRFTYVQWVPAQCVCDLRLG